MMLITERYVVQREQWPKRGQHILAHYNDQHIVVYQAYKPSIGHAAVAQGTFREGGDFSFERMSWIKPNFLWMMYRSGWGTKPGQEVTLAITLTRAGFDTILARAVHSSFVPEVYSTEAEWKRALAASTVRLQWDPDHAPNGFKQERRAIQLALRGESLMQYAREWIVQIEDISDFVAQQRAHVESNSLDSLLTPVERVYLIADAAVAARLGTSVL